MGSITTTNGRRRHERRRSRPLVRHVRDAFEHQSYNVQVVWPQARRRQVTVAPYEVSPLPTLIQMSAAAAAKAFPRLLRHSPGTVLPHRIYVVREEAANQLRAAGVQCTEWRRESTRPSLAGVGAGESI